MRCRMNYVKKDGSRFNCGKCPACKANKNSEWKLRCVYELHSWDCATWITLTYSDVWMYQHNVSKQGFLTLLKKDIVNYNKRVRSDIEYSEPGRKIKYYCVGEYSPEKQRPHYHCIYFGLDYASAKDRNYLVSNWLPRCDELQFDLRRGKKCAIQPVTMEDIGYTTDYNNKKLFGDYAKKEYSDKGREPPFHVLSNGLGLEFALTQKQHLVDTNFVMLSGKKIGIPKYFRDKLEIKVEHENIKPFSYKRFINDTVEQNKYLMNLFLKQKKIHYPIDPSNYSLFINQFDKWLENREFELANQVYDDFIKRQELKHNNYE